jgi:hypothetical protein
MRTKLRSKVTLLFMTCAVVLAIPAIALADNLQDTVTGGSPSKTIATGTANAWTNDYWVQATGSGPAGCDIGAAPAKFKLNVPPGVTADTTDLSFAACGTSTTNTVPVKFSSNTPGVYNISATYVSGGTAGDTFNEGPADLTLTVVGVTSVTPANGATGVAVTSDATATFSQNVTGVSGSTFKLVKDGDVTNTSVPAAVSYNSTTKTATLNPTSDLLPSTKYNATISGVQFDGVTLEAKTWSFTTAAPPPPSCTNPADPTFSGTPDGSNGWYKSIPAVSASSTAGATVQYSLNAAGPFSNTAPTLGQGQTTVYAKAVSGTCSSGVSSQLYKVDTIAPSINDDGSTQTPNGAGWFNTAVSNDFSASDATSGLPASFTNPFSVSSGTDEGSAVNINSGPVSDNAGNTNPGIDSAAFKIDMTDPVANCDSAPTSWSATDVSIRCQPTDALSGLANTADDGDFNLSTSVAADTETSNASTNSRTVADAAGNSVTAGPITGLKVDKKAPGLADEGPTTTPDGANGWYKSAVTNGFKATDGGSGFAPSGNLTDSFTKSSGTNEGAAVKIASGAVSDAVGNSTDSIDSAAFKIDLSNPTNVAFVGGPAAGSSHYFGSVPNAPTCTADDAVSGIPANGCVVTGYSTAVGNHTMTATATDNAGRTATATRQYTVDPWTFKGFYQPIDMGTTLNTVKGGSTVPFKFELFAGSTELTDTAKVDQPLRALKVACDTGATLDDIELTATGGTSLRYDTTGGQYIYNWQTPKQPGACYNVTITANDGSFQTAHFKLK